MVAPRIEVRGEAETAEGRRDVIRILPERIVSRGIESEQLGQRHARDVPVTRS